MAGRAKPTHHPHADERVVLVHNGIIENFQALREELTAKGHSFETDTDTEAVVHLVSSLLAEGKSPQEAVAAALKRLEGAFALAILFAGEDRLMIGARRSPLAIGYGDGEMYIGSDALALAPLTERISYLEEGDWAEITADGAVVHDDTDAVVERPVRQTATSGAMTGKGGFPHFMLKEIYEQPAVIGDTLHTFVNPWSNLVTLPELPFDLAAVSRVTIIACGTSYHAGMVARYWLERSHACRSIWISLPNSAIAPSTWNRAGCRSLSRSPARRRIRSPRCATRNPRGSTRSPSSTFRKARWLGKRTPCC